MKRLKRLNVSGLQSGEIPSEPGVSEEPSHLAFCPLLVKYADKGMCALVDCRNCDFPKVEFEDSEMMWLCSVCAGEALVAQPYWGDGKCEGCGFPSSMLAYCEV